MELSNKEFAITTEKLNLWYANFQAIYDIDLSIKKGKITSLIGPSGCGKSTLLRCFNRINERIPSVRTSGHIKIFEENIFAEDVDLAQLRKKIGMVFQRPNPLPLSVKDNILFSYRVHKNKKERSKSAEMQVLEKSLRRVLLWDKVKDRLKKPALGLSLEEKQKLCIARILPVQPEVILMDEPCSALDPQGTEAIEELMVELKKNYTIVIVTHNMQQAKRISDEAIFMLMGRLEEHSSTKDIFSTPQKTTTQNYIEGRYC